MLLMYVRMIAPLICSCISSVSCMLQGLEISISVLQDYSSDHGDHIKLRSKLTEPISFESGIKFKNFQVINGND